MMELVLNSIAKLHWVLESFVSLLSSQPRVCVGNGRPFGPLDNADGCQLAFSLSSAFYMVFLVFIYDFLFSSLLSCYDMNLVNAFLFL